MAKSRTAKEPLQRCTIKSNGKVVKVGDSVLMRAHNPDQRPYVARVEKIESDARKNVKVGVRWYYRPEDSKGGRRQFHGAKELFLSDHLDTQSVNTIEDTCVVHSFSNYTKLESVASEDYFCRFHYMTTTGAFLPDRVPVYCTCELPYNPDDLMVQCERCRDWPSVCNGTRAEDSPKGADQNNERPAGFLDESAGDVYCGRGDRRTARGKRFNHSFGNARPRDKTKGRGLPTTPLPPWAPKKDYIDDGQKIEIEIDESILG